MLDLFNSIFTNGSAFLMLAAGFCFLIFVHELGHFLAAKMVKCRVQQFAVGFGPALFAWRKGIGARRGSTEPERDRLIREHLAKTGRVHPDTAGPTATDQSIAMSHVRAAESELGLGETEYRLNLLLLLGGYVKLLGQEDLKPDAISDDPHAYNRQPAWARAVILSAGVFMNLIFALVFFVIAFTAGVTFPPAVVGGVLRDAPASKVYAIGHDKDPAYLGLKPGDRILTANGSQVTDFSDLALRTALTQEGDSLRLRVERDGEKAPLEFDVTPVKLRKSRYLMLGVSEPYSPELPPDAIVSPEFAKSGVKPGMVLSAAAGQPVTRVDQADDAIERGRGTPVDVTFKHPTSGETANAQVSAVPNLSTATEGLSSPDAEAAHLLGLVPVVVVPALVPDAPAQKAGVMPGDIIAQLDGRYWPRLDQVQATVKNAGSRAMPLSVLRDGKMIELTPVKVGRDRKIGVVLSLPQDQLIIADVLPDSPFAAVEPAINPGSRVLAVNGTPVKNLAELQRAFEDAVNDRQSATLAVEIERNIKTQPRQTVSVTVTAAQAKPLLAAGWSAPSMGLPVLTLPLTTRNPVEATRLGVIKTHQFMLQTYLSLARFASGDIHISEARGMIGIAQAGTAVARDRGWGYLVFFLGLISVNLVVMNFLPIPILDGGQMLFLILEKIKGSPVSIRTQTIATYIGLALIGSLLLVTLYYDTIRLFTS